MATYSSHRLIMGKVEIETISAVSLEIFDFFSIDMFIEKSCKFHMTFVQIA